MTRKEIKEFLDWTIGQMCYFAAQGRNPKESPTERAMHMMRADAFEIMAGIFENPAEVKRIASGKWRHVGEVKK